MGPFTFLSPAFLAALAAAALPILIHLFSRRRAREMPFSQLRFLDEVTRRKIRRMQLRQWLLLLLRTLAIACIALALSRPVWHGPGAGRQRGDSTVAILLDDSYSMGARLDPAGVLPIDVQTAGVNQPTRFEQARQRALQIVDLLEEGDRALLVFTASPPRMPYESTVRDPSLLREEILRARPRATRADLVTALERISPVMRSSRTLNRELFVVSDFQEADAAELLQRLGGEAQAATVVRPSASGGTEASENVATADAGAEGVAGADRAPDEPPAQEVLLVLPEQTQTYLLPVPAPSEPNAAVIWGFFEPDPTGASGRLNVRVRNHSSDPIEEGVLQVLDGETGGLLAEGMVSAEAGAVGQAVVALSELPESGLLTVRSAPDLLARDNERYIATSSTSRFRVLIVTGGELSDPQVRAEVTYPVLALDPFGGARLLEAAAESEDAVGSAADLDAGARAQAQGIELFEVQTVPETDLGLLGMLDVDAVVLLNVGRLSAGAAEMLERYHADGGNVLIALGDRVDGRTYNTQILPRLADVRLENVIGDLESDSWFSLLPAATGHEIFEGFPVAPGEALSAARFRRLLDVRLGPESRVLGEFSGGHPALIEEPGVLLFTSSLDMRWSDFPTSASYLPFLHRALLHMLLQGRIGRQDPQVGEPLTHRLPPELARETLRCEGPDGIEVEVELVQTERGTLLRTAPVAEPGFYRIFAGPSAEPLQTTAVNVDTRESDLSAMSARTGELLFGEGAITLSAEQEMSRQVLEARYGRELWRLLLVLAFLLLVAESLIARGRWMP